jgi:SAM-dependent methyltransferase
VQAKPFCRNVIAVTCDAYQLPFQENSFDVVISFGRAWVASYKGVAPEVARVTKPGGMVIMDFINDLSAYELFLQNWRFVKRLLWYLGIAPGGDKYHDLGCMGIKRSYSRFGLELSCLHYIGACSPLGNAISIQSFGLLEKLWPMKRVFSRILLGVFTKKAE